MVWEEKPEEVVEMCKKKLPVLKEVKGREIINDPNKPVNLLIEGDNYHALSVLNYTHAKKVDVIYIDPPYNTGARDWKYNNNFVDEEDPYRHSKWLSFMDNRLRLAKNLLSVDGIICVTIDDNEMPRLWLLLEEIFRETNHLGTVAIRINPGGRKSKRKVAAQHEYALFFSRNACTSVAKILLDPEEKTHSYQKDENGEWHEERNLRKEGADSLSKPDSERYYPIYIDPETGKISAKIKHKIKILPIDTSGKKRIWRRSKDVIDDMYNDGNLFVKDTKFGKQIYFKFKGGLEGETPKSFWSDTKYSASEHGTQTLDSILGEREKFNFPKSPYATADCIRVASSKKDAIVLDFFAGSGTTAHSVLLLNNEDGGIRKFILCTNNENNICTEVCYPRIEKVMRGYKNTKGEQVEGLGSNLKYFKTDFVDAEPTDKNKKRLTEQATEMLCIREGTYEKVLERKDFNIFKNSHHYTGIVFDQMAIPEFKEAIKEIKGKFSIYIFSLSDDIFDEEFEDVNQKIKLSPIPEAILRVYRRIFK
ncbi:MAG: site-specific DNA-methyltransferase [Nitrospira sp.]|nr:site-specific DNA-methyltransferase [Nitrospira sp.]